jgi:tRNA (cytidine/uridine-2'-O-)-methyltransferase
LAHAASALDPRGRAAATDPERPLRLALYQPDIPQNTGTLLRTCACLAVPVDIIRPAGFDLGDKALKRAGLDYLGAADLALHETYDAFEQAQRRAGRRIVLLTTRAASDHLAFAFAPADTLLLGRESAGVPDAVHAAADARVKIPIVAGLRSLNIAIAGAMILGEALRQTNGYPPPR